MSRSGGPLLEGDSCPEGRLGNLEDLRGDDDDDDEGGGGGDLFLGEGAAGAALLGLGLSSVAS